MGIKVFFFYGNRTEISFMETMSYDTRLSWLEGEIPPIK